MGNDKIVKKIVFDVPMKTRTPLRISSGVDDGVTDILVLKDKNGRAFIPGTSVAGVLRSRINSIYNDEAEEKLFGSAEEENGSQSMINISDIVLENARVINRDGIKIDPVTGVSDKDAKYDFEAIDRGAEGTLKIEITVRKNDLREENKPFISYRHNQFAVKNDGVYDELAAAIADILTTGISVGALTTKGFGRIKSVEPVRFYVFDFAKDGFAGKWLDFLDGKYRGEPVYTSSQAAEILAKDDFVMNMDFALKSTLIIRDYDAAEFEESENKILAVQMKSKDEYVIPGTSIKGALKSRAYNILMQLKGNDEDKANAFLDSFMGREKGRLNNVDKGAKSSLYVDEVYIKSARAKLMKQTRNRIDRFTGGTIESNLFTDEPIYQTELMPAVSMKLRIKNCKEQQAGLMLLLLKDLWLGNLAIGGGKSIGRGVLCGRKCTIDYKGDSFIIEDKEKFTVTGDKNILEGYVRKLVN